MILYNNSSKKLHYSELVTWLMPQRYSIASRRPEFKHQYCQKRNYILQIQSERIIKMMS
jgi:hypothetical protein